MDLLLTKSSESLEVARFLYNQGYSEFAIERAFCSLYYLANDWLQVRKRISTNHSATIKAFERRFGSVDDFSKFVQYLKLAETARADFETRHDKEVTVDEALLHLNHAQEFLTFTLKRLKGDPQ